MGFRRSQFTALTSGFWGLPVGVTWGNWERRQQQIPSGNDRKGEATAKAAAGLSTPLRFAPNEQRINSMESVVARFFGLDVTRKASQDAPDDGVFAWEIQTWVLEEVDYAGSQWSLEPDFWTAAAL